MTAPVVPAQAPAENLLPAIALVVAGLSTAGLSGALLKLMSSELNVAMMTAGRYSGYLLVLMPLAMWKYGKAVFMPPQWRAQFARSVLILAATVTFVLAVQRLPLANAVAILYIYPFLVAALAPWLLHERVGAAIWLGVTAGFAGIIIVMRPDLDALNVGALWALASGVVYALHIILTRKVANSAPPMVSNTYMAIVALVLILPFAIWMWQPVNLRQAVILLVMGGVNAAAHLLLINAFRLAPAPALAPYTYAELVAATVWGMLFFAHVPDSITLLGIGIIIAAGLMVAQSNNIARAIARRRGISGGG